MARKQPKYWLGDKVFLMHNNKVTSGVIKVIEIQKLSNVILISYDVFIPKLGYGQHQVTENNLFLNKKELIKSLL